MTWIQTFTGRAFDLLNPSPEQVAIEDIAHHLALINRFTGATTEPYSVAQHSVLCSLIVAPELALTALLHDAAEAYVTDVSRPLKLAMRTVATIDYAPVFQSVDGEVRPMRGVAVNPYDEISRRVEAAIGARFGLDLVSLPAAVKHADMVMLATERVHLHHSTPRPWDHDIKPASFDARQIAPWPWYVAEAYFMAMFLRYTKASYQEIFDADVRFGEALSRAARR